MTSDESSPQAAPPAPRSQSSLSRADWLRLASGFSKLLWSIPLGLFLFTGAIRVHWAPLIQVPSYLMAAALYCWGILTLRKTPSLTSKWRQTLHLSLVLGVLLFYFAPFIYWWERRPMIDHLAINVFAFLFAVTWILWLINALAEAIATRLEDKVFFIETRLCRWSVGLFMILPVLTFWVMSTWRASRYGIPLSQFIQDLLFVRQAYWLFAAFILPLTLTLTMVWKTRKRILTQVIAEGNQS